MKGVVERRFEKLKFLEMKIWGWIDKGGDGEEEGGD